MTFWLLALSASQAQFVGNLLCRQLEAATRDIYVFTLSGSPAPSCTAYSHTYIMGDPGTPSAPPPEVAAGTYLSGKTALFPDSEGGLTGFTPLDPVLPSQNWTVTGTGVIIWPVRRAPPPPWIIPPGADCVSVQPTISLGTLCRSYNCSL